MPALFDHLAAAFGEGPDRQGAFEEGRLKRAQTERALAAAAEARDAAIARSRLRGADFANPSNDTLFDLMVGGLGSDFASTMQGRLRGQEYGFRETIADPETDMAARQYAAQAVAGRPVNYLDPMGQGGYADIRAPEAGVQMSPLGDALIDATQALAEQRRRTTGEPVVQVVDPDTGEVVYRPRSEAIGMQAPPRAGQPPLSRVGEEALLRDVVQYLGWTVDEEGNRVRDPALAQQQLQEILAQQPGAVGAEDLPPGIPPGSQLIGHTATGAPVYQTPDGQRLVAD